MSGNDSDNNQICVEDTMNEFMSSARDPYIHDNLFDEPENQEEIDDGIIFSTNSGEVVIEVNDQYIYHTSKKYLSVVMF